MAELPTDFTPDFNALPKSEQAALEEFWRLAEISDREYPMRILEEGNLKRVHINRHTLTRNKKRDERADAVGVEYYAQGKKQKTYGHQVEILGPCTVIQNDEKPLSCGAKCWIETRSKVKLTRSR